MSVGGEKKQYGLIIPSKVKEASLNFRARRVNPLIDSDDELEKDEEESENTLDWIEQTMKKSAGNAGVQSLQKRRIKEAFQEDSTIFQYDEIYDDIKNTEQEKKKKTVEKKSKYIENILKHTEKRKLENERRQERKVQKERDDEGEEFADKESFVTSSYLKKLEEIKIAEEEERKTRYMEETIDVHKHKNFGVFFNHILKQRVGDQESETPVVPPVIKQEPEEESVPIIKQEPEEEDDSDDDSPARRQESESERPTHFIKTKDSRRKAYRTNREESESPQRNSASPKRTKRREDPSLDEENNTSPRKERKKSHKESEKKRKKSDTESVKVEVEDTEEEKPVRKTIKDLPVEERIDKYEVTFAVKSTGNVYNELLQRYFERKANKTQI